MDFFLLSPIKNLSLFFNPMDLKKSLPSEWNKVFAVALAAIGIFVVLYRAFTYRQATIRPTIELIHQSKLDLLPNVFPEDHARYPQARVILTIEKARQCFHQSVTLMHETNYEAIDRFLNEKINRLDNLNEIPQDAKIQIGVIFTHPNLDHFSYGAAEAAINGIGGHGSSRFSRLIINQEIKQHISEEFNLTPEQLFD